MTFYCAFSVPIADVWTLAIAIADRAGALSSALVIDIRLAWRWIVDDPGTPADASTVERKLLMLMINDAGDINGMSVPSPSDNWEHTGPYAGIRLDLASAGAVGWSDMLNALDLRTADGRQLGTILVAGGLAL